MNINVTLLCQIINFCIAYQIIDKIFLRYAIIVIDKQEAELRYLTELKARHAFEVRTLSQRVRQEWQAYQQILQKQIPDPILISCMPSHLSFYRSEPKILRNKEQLLATTVDVLFNKIRLPHA